MTERNKLIDEHDQFMVDQVNSVYKKIDSGDAKFVSHEEAKRLMKPTSIRLKPTLKMKIEAMAKEEDRSFNNMMTRLLESALA